MAKVSKRPQCIVISGIDGSGKTTIINNLKITLESEGYRVNYIWLRFNHYFAKVMHAIARSIGLSVKVNNEMGNVWQHRFYKSNLFCYLYVIATFLDTMISRLKYNKAAQDVDVVICDRWITDICVDIATKTHDKNFIKSNMCKRFFKIAPENAKFIVISRNLTELLNCRLENRVDPDFQFRLSVYKDLMDSPMVVPIDNNGTIKEAVINIINNFENE